MRNKDRKELLDSVHKQNQLTKKVINLFQEFIRVNPDVKYLSNESFNDLFKVAQRSFFNEQNKDKIDEYTQNIHNSARNFYDCHGEQYMNIDSLLKSLIETVTYYNSYSFEVDIEEKIKHNEIFLRELLTCLASTPLDRLSLFLGSLMKEVIIKQTIVNEFSKAELELKQEADHDPAA